MSHASRDPLLLFGSTGAIGKLLRRELAGKGWRVVCVSRTQRDDTGDDSIVADPLSKSHDPSVFDRYAPYSAVVWAQGANINDSVYTVDVAKNLDLYNANCLYVAVTLRHLLERKLLAPAARLCVISSIWQNIARQNKLSYCMTKAALQGLVLSAAADLGKDGHFINAVLPGALETPMTRQNLLPEQIEKLRSSTLFDRLPSPDAVASLVSFLCSEENTSITGQSIAVDLGFSHVRIL